MAKGRRERRIFADVYRSKDMPMGTEWSMPVKNESGSNAGLGRHRQNESAGQEAAEYA